MTQRSFKDLKIELDTSGAVLTDISQYVTGINGWSKERLLEEVTGAGETTDRWKPLGFLQKGEIELTGPYDDAAGGLVALTKDWSDDAERTLQLTFDGATAADVESMEVLLQQVQRNPARGQLHEYVVTLRPTGAVT